MSDASTQRPPNRYAQLIERIFFAHYTEGAREVPFGREAFEQATTELGLTAVKNLGDLIYTFRYRLPLPESIREKAPPGEAWVIWPTGRAKYKFLATDRPTIVPNSLIAETKVPDATPGVIAKYALTDEQALLAKVRYNRLVDVFTGVACYSLQSHLRTQVTDMGQVETDEVYVGVDKRGVHYVFPVQAKGGKDVLSIVQIGQDAAMCAERFPMLVRRPIAAQFMAPDLIALFSFEVGEHGLSQLDEKHYRLVHPDAVSSEDLAAYRLRPDDR